ncbi:MAG: hypothetical protein IH609_02710, partial [Dehalococcoidia bacterium]|nr:hypothetical protein [Dehalococcoidia bacterium]
LVEGSLKAASLTFEAPYRSGPPDAEVARELERLEAELADAKSRGVPEGERRAIAAKATMARMERVALARTRDKGPFREEEVQAMRLGDGLYVVGLPGEVFYETGEEIRRLSGLEDLIVIAYANDYPGYFCRAEAFAEGGYEAGVTPFAPEADALLVKAAVEVLERVR